MSTKDVQVVEAYVIDSNGVETAVPAGFAETKKSAHPRAAANPYVYAAASAYGPSSPFARPAAQRSASSAFAGRPLSLGRRLLGAGLMLVGLPLLILPGPGFLLVGLGLLLMIKP